MHFTRVQIKSGSKFKLTASGQKHQRQLQKEPNRTLAKQNKLYNIQDTTIQPHMFKNLERKFK